MKTVVWDDAYSVGFKPIDDQHKKLIRMIDELFKHCAEGDVAAGESFLETIKEAAAYSQTHFTDEENYMIKAKYPDLAVHKKQHEAFIGVLLDKIIKFQVGGAEPEKLAEFLRNWLLTHIAVLDKKYTPYLAKL